MGAVIDRFGEDGGSPAGEGLARLRGGRRSTFFRLARAPVRRPLRIEARNRSRQGVPGPARDTGEAYSGERLKRLTAGETAVDHPPARAQASSLFERPVPAKPGCDNAEEQASRATARVHTTLTDRRRSKLNFRITRLPVAVFSSDAASP